MPVLFPFQVNLIPDKRPALSAIIIRLNDKFHCIYRGETRW